MNIKHLLEDSLDKEFIRSNASEIFKYLVSELYQSEQIDIQPGDTSAWLVLDEFAGNKLSLIQDPDETIYLEFIYDNAGNNEHYKYELTGKDVQLIPVTLRNAMRESCTRREKVSLSLRDATGAGK